MKNEKQINGEICTLLSPNGLAKFQVREVGEANIVESSEGLRDNFVRRYRGETRSRWRTLRDRYGWKPS